MPYIFSSPVKIQKTPTEPSSAGLFSRCVFYHEDFVLSASYVLHFTRTWYDGLFSLIFFSSVGSNWVLGQEGRGEK